MSIINKEISDFKAYAFHENEFKTVSKDDILGKWSVFFFYPADFTFICPTELEDLANKYEEFRNVGCEIYSVSTDTHFVHKAWHDASERIKKINYPMLADPTHSISKDFEVLIESDGLAERGTFIINPEGKIVGYEITAGKALKEQKQKIIVVIDDIDRLTNTQIRLIFQLVNSLAGFPNMIYLLSFDKSVVIRALSEEQKCNGEEYLEKIIQVPFEIPEANKKLIDDAFCKKVEDIILTSVEPDETFNVEYWQQIFPSCISPFISTMRDVNRIVNTYKFKFGLMREETNCIDLLAITTLQICANEIYNWIFNNTSLITGSTKLAKSTSIDEQKKTAEKYLTEFKTIYTKNPNLMLRVLQNLFPKFSWNTGGYTYNHDDELTLKHNQRIASSDRINRYFNLSLEDIVIDKKQILQTITNYDSMQLREYFEALTQSDALYDYLNELIAYVSDIPFNRRSYY